MNKESNRIESKKEEVITAEDQKKEEVVTAEDEGKEKWSSNFEYLLTSLSYVIGFGNIWRFPYICYKNGGGAFLIPYFLSLIFMGLPVMLVEMTLGQYSAKGKVIVWQFMPIFFGIGISMMIAVFVQGLYYCMLIAWSLYYFFSSITLDDLPWTSCGHEWNTWRCTNSTTNETYRSPSDEYWHRNILQINENIEDVSTLNGKVVGCQVFAWILVYFSLVKGIRSLGKVSYLTAILPFFCLTILLIRGLILDGAMDGIKFYLIPDFNRLLDFNVWVDASQQIFFSLGIAWGMIITMSSHNHFSHRLIRDALIISIGNSFASIFAGLVIFSFMGSVAHQRQMDVSDVATEGPGLAFIIYPEAVTKFPFGQIFSALFFFMLILLGLGSQTPSIESVISTIFDYFPQKRKFRPLILFLVCLISLSLGLIYCTQSGFYWFVLSNDFCASTAPMIIALVEMVAISWVYGVDKFLDHIEEMIGKIPKTRISLRIVLKYITPSYLLVILILTVYTTKEPEYGDYKFPKWTVYLGWLVNFGTVAPIPIVAAYYLIKCYFNRDINLKDVSVPDVKWKSEVAEKEEENEEAKNGEDTKKEAEV